MRIKGLTDEDFVNYKLPSMYICTSTCDFKCDKESGMRCCQNSALAKEQSVIINDDTLIKRYLQNPITKAIVFAGLEPMDQSQEVYHFINLLRMKYKKNDPVVIYTGYTEDELKNSVAVFSQFPNIIMKFGRYIPNREKHYDEVLGVWLASPNQYAKELS